MGGLCGGGPAANGGEVNTATTGDSNNPNDIHSKYQFRRTLGKGASCRVVEALDKSDKSKKLAIKIMSKDKPMSEKLYSHEVSVLSKLEHKNIIQFVGSHEDEANFYVLTSLCEGGELFDRIVNPEYQITEKKAATLIRNCLEALQYIHAANIVHRDLKPENFVFETTDDNANIVLIDFGCAKFVKDEDEYRDLVGTVYYLAPELAAQSSRIKRTGYVLKQADMWSLGVIAYVMLTGRPPFKGKSNKEIFTRIVRDQVKFPEDAQLSDSFKDFVKKALVKKPDKRMTVDEALQHPWVTGVGASNARLNTEVVGYLRQFNYQSRLKKAITKILAENMSNEPQQEIERHFKRLDVDGDGFLDRDELKLLLNDLGYAASVATEEAQKILESADTNGDGLIEFKEFAAIWHRKLLSEHDQYIHRVFEVFDRNHDGQVDSSELSRVLGESGGAISMMISEVDANGDGKISFDEFKNAMKEDLQTKGFPASTLMVGAEAAEQKDLAEMDILSEPLSPQSADENDDQKQDD